MGFRLAAVVAAVVALACASDERRGRVLLVGLDGATLRVAQPLLWQGRLPNLERIAAEGVHGPLQSFPPLASPRIWTTIATGKVPEKHEITSFVREGEDGSKALYLASDRKAHALWNITSDAGLVTSVVNWWTTFPPAKLRGVVVTDHLLEAEVRSRRELFDTEPDPLGATAFPEEWIGRSLEIARTAPDASPRLEDPLAGVVEDLPPTPERERFASVPRNDRAAVEIALAVEAELRPDVLLVFMAGIDRVSHALWGAFESPTRFAATTGVTAAQAEAARAALLDYYAYADRLLGLLLERYGPEDLVLVVSDHGFEEGDPHQGPGLLTGMHETDRASRGALFARGPGIRRAARVEGTTVNDVTPTVLAWLGLPLGADMDGTPAAFLERRPTRAIATHDTRPLERVATVSRGAEEEVIEQLRGLGYLDE